MFTKGIFKAVLPVFYLTIILLTGGHAAQNQIALKATFPDQQYREWQTAQRSPASDAESKIKSTIDTFLIVEYESWVRGELLDFGFLFDQTDPQARGEYQDELGYMHYRLAGLKAWDLLLLHYEYLPTFSRLSIEGNKARVNLKSKTSVVHRIRPNYFEGYAVYEYVFSLKSVEGCWLIKSVSSNDAARRGFPHGTDFARLAASITNQIKKLRAEADENDRLHPRPKSEGKPTLFDKISGFYEGLSKEEDGSRLSLLISVEEGVPFVIGRNHLRAELRQFKGKQDEFSFIAKDGETVYLKFLEDDLGEVARCVFRKGGSSVELNNIARRRYLK